MNCNKKQNIKKCEKLKKKRSVQIEINVVYIVLSNIVRLAQFIKTRYYEV